MTEERIRDRSALANGVVAILIGIVLFVNQLQVMPFELHFWPVVLVAGGILQIFKAATGQGRLWGLGLIAAGVIIELHAEGITHFGIRQMWPLFIVIAGISMLWRAWEGSPAVEENSDGNSVNPGERIQLDYVFGGGEPRFETKHFKGGKITAVFGGFKVDLTRSEMEGAQAVLHVDAVFGGGEVRVPEKWLVVMQGSGVFGGYEDRTRHIQPDATQPVQTLLVKGAAVFGGIVIRN